MKHSIGRPSIVRGQRVLALEKKGTGLISTPEIVLSNAHPRASFSAAALEIFVLHLGSLLVQTLEDLASIYYCGLVSLRVSVTSSFRTSHSRPVAASPNSSLNLLLAIKS